MKLVFTPYIFPSLAAAAVSAWLARYAWLRRPSAGSVSFTVLMLAIAQWSLSYSLELGVMKLETKILWASVQYVGIVITPVAWLAFALEYGGREKWLSRRNLIALSVVPLITLLLAVTNDAHHLIYRQVVLDSSGPFEALDFRYSFWFWVFVAYAYGLLFAGTIVLASAVRQTLLALYRWQAVALLFGVLMPWIANVLHLLELGPVPELALTPIGFAISGLVVAVGVLRFRLFDIIPVARQVVVENMRDGMFVLDRYGRIVDVNKAGLAMVGRDTGEVIGRLASRILAGSDGASLVGDGDDSTEVQAEITLAQMGREHYFEMQISPLHDQRSHPRGRLVILRDISERKQAEMELLAQKQLFQNLVAVARATSERPTLEATLQNALDVSVSLTGAELGSLFLLDSASAATHSILSRGKTSFVKSQHIVNEVMNGGLAGWVTRNRRPALIDDTREDDRWLELPDAPYDARSVLAVPILNRSRMLGLLTLQHSQPHHFTAEHSNLMQAAVDQMALALQNAQVYDIIEKERSRLQALIASSRDGIILVSVDHKVLVVNGRALKLLGLPGEPEEWVNRPAIEAITALRKQIPEASELINGELRRQARQDAPPGEGEIEVPPRTIHWLNLPVPAGDRPLGRLWVLRDVTEERMLERIREDLTHALVHDLRNPLNNIASAQELFADVGSLSADQKSLLEVARGSTHQMLAMVNAILDISRLESGRMPIEQEPVDIEACIANVVQAQVPLARTKDIDLLFDVPAGLPPALGDVGLIERVLQNLVGNALKFTPPGGEVIVTAQVSDEARKGANGDQPPLCISVSDTGPGVPADVQERLFQKFTTGRQKASGSGLGLAFCKMVVESHGGRIWSTSRPDRGATFHFTLPNFAVGELDAAPGAAEPAIG